MVNKASLLAAVAFILAGPLDAAAQSPKRPALIRDTDVAEGKNETEADKEKVYNPMMAEKCVDVGNFYLKRKNYAAAIERYLEALEYQPNLISAFEALGRAYEKDGKPAKALEVYNDFLRKYPNSPKSPDFRSKAAKLERKSG
jgi:tetratricopeptide (TPR) repeat protein